MLLDLLNPGVPGGAGTKRDDFRLEAASTPPVIDPVRCIVAQFHSLAQERDEGAHESEDLGIVGELPFQSLNIA